MKITVIGAGNMGGALARGWAKSDKMNVADITVADKSEAVLAQFKKEFPMINTTSDNVAAVKDAEIVVVAVKPWLVETVVGSIKDAVDYKRQIVVSIAANVLIERLTELFAKADGSVPALFYTIPNIAAEFGASMSFVASAKDNSEEARNKVYDLFRIVGDVLPCEERLVGPGMMMASCGIAYVMRYIRAQMEGGVEMGFYPKEALAIALQTMQGAINLLRETGLHPEAAIDKVTTPGGTTIKGLNELDHAGFSSAVIRSLKAGLK
jgi:pyrroline-5-carboxylate reductase